MKSCPITFTCETLRISQLQLAQKLGVTPETVSRWKNKKHRIREVHRQLLLALLPDDAVEIFVQMERK